MDKNGTKFDNKGFFISFTYQYREIKKKIGGRRKISINDSKSDSLPQKSKYEPEDTLLITDPNIIPLINHEKKKVILDLLLHSEKTIMELSTATGWNPGTVKRHLTDLVEGTLVVVAREEFNQKKILLKYYRTTAFHFVFHFEWP
ncbi:hypothetical protein NEF87_003496 [Candidatus Lokiarchaeum ossiferum]|uniref:HTH arsR-type domain-containing protein n=1 Tax=Candidatus Lokiarchaeum ossiferum TaxID=2951803 RepID=A0ABY6HUX3_9ARCH|nr:hypothetical protein NEF87_003496 [Candidatus Lokiarchaeum sp. B-35]